MSLQLSKSPNNPYSFKEIRENFTKNEQKRAKKEGREIDLITDILVEANHEMRLFTYSEFLQKLGFKDLRDDN